jgi:hypothetical protein
MLLTFYLFGFIHLKFNDVAQLLQATSSISVFNLTNVVNRLHHSRHEDADRAKEA